MRTKEEALVNPATGDLWGDEAGMWFVRKPSTGLLELVPCWGDMDALKLGGGCFLYSHEEFLAAYADADFLGGDE